MMDITIITVGATKDPALKILEQKFITFLKPYAKITRRHVRALPFNSEKDKEQVTQKEAGLLLKTLPSRGKIILLSERGKTYTTETFSKQLITWTEHESLPLTFVFAGPLGPHQLLTERVTTNLSLSPLTMTHELALIVLLEQLYRTGTILHGKNYHY
jgi:23S rRNA (pseudouridine1915-N3)-methyltransferase